MSISSLANSYIHPAGQMAEEIKSQIKKRSEVTSCCLCNQHMYLFQSLIFVNCEHVTINNKIFFPFPAKYILTQ